MAGCDQWALLKVFEVILCVTCLLYKWWTDEEASRLFFYLEKNSLEWPLLNNITWNQAGSWFADITYGGYVIITIGLLLAHVLGESQYTRKTESFLLGIGALLFFGAGCMVITSFDNVPDSLVDNAIILGILSIITGFVFLVDIGCLKRRQRDKGVRRDKEFRMNGGRDIVDGPALQQQVAVVEKPAPTQNGRADPKQEEIISELRSSMKKKREKPADQPSLQQQNERLQTEDRLQQRRYSGSRSAPRSHSVERDTSYDYDQQSIRNYDSDPSDDSEPYHYDRRSRGSQTSRKHFQKTVEKVILRDAETSTDTPTMVKTTTTVHYKIQSPTVSTTDPHKSDSPATSEEGYELHPPASSSYLLSNGKKFQPVITASRIERLAQNAQSLNKDLQRSSVPSSPQDPGYVLHTASKWPNTTALAPQPFRKVKDEIVLRPVHSAV